MDQGTYESMVDSTFTMARKSMGMADPCSPKMKPVVTQSSPQSRRVARDAARNSRSPPPTCMPPNTGIARQRLENAGRAGMPRGTRAQMAAAGFGGGGYREFQQGQDFCDRNIQPYTQAPPQVQYSPQCSPQTPPRRTSKKPTGVLCPLRKRPVYVKRRVVRVIYPADKPTNAPALTEAVPLRPKQETGEERFPGASQGQKIIKGLQFKLQAVQRKLEEKMKGPVPTREPYLGGGKGNMQVGCPMPMSYDQAGSRRRQREDEDLRVQRRARTQHARRNLFDQAQQQQDCPGVCPMFGAEQDPCGTPRC